jgi:hypothetical protein
MFIIYIWDRVHKILKMRSKRVGFSDLCGPPPTFTCQVGQNNFKNVFEEGHNRKDRKHLLIPRRLTIQFYMEY